LIDQIEVILSQPEASGASVNGDALSTVDGEIGAAKVS
jgi:hypothetical protein